MNGIPFFQEIQATALPEWLLAVSLVLMLLDLFIDTSFLAYISLIVFSLWGTQTVAEYTGMGLPWALPVFLLFFVLGVWLYVFECRVVARSFLLKYLTGGAPPELKQAVVGRTGVVQRAGNSFAVSVDDELLPIDPACADDLREGEPATITGWNEGTVQVKRPEKTA
ncbi:MAG: hypothetical protein MSQ05_06345 [Akkermansia sp.]|nr:hypothetical protein [Akkermansia sp.]